MKNEILKILKSNEDFISGQQLCNEFNVSRTAVWKAIQALREQGYNIESVTNKGYRLVSAPDIINKAEIESFLATDFIGKKLIVLDTVDSTNTYLKSIANNSPEGTVVTTREQTLGKGRLGRVWNNKKDSALCFSVLLRPCLSPMEVSAITPLCGLAVAKALNQYFDFNATIKWPNDVIIGNKKICGILTEMSCEFDKVDYIVVGIGINITSSAFPQEIAYKATSCKGESNREINKNKLLALILKEIEDILSKSDYRFNEENLQLYKNSCATIGRLVTFTRQGKEFSGKATDINKNGELVVTLNDGSKETVFSGEVTVQGIY